MIILNQKKKKKKKKWLFYVCMYVSIYLAGYSNYIQRPHVTSPHSLTHEMVQRTGWFRFFFHFILFRGALLSNPPIRGAPPEKSTKYSYSWP